MGQSHVRNQIISITKLIFFSPLLSLFLSTLSQNGERIVLQDLRLLLGSTQGVGRHRSRHHLDRDGHGRGAHGGDGTEELPGQPLAGPTLLPVYQQNPDGKGRATQRY